MHVVREIACNVKGGNLSWIPYVACDCEILNIKCQSESELDSP